MTCAYFSDGLVKNHQLVFLSSYSYDDDDDDDDANPPPKKDIYIMKRIAVPLSYLSPRLLEFKSVSLIKKETGTMDSPSFPQFMGLKQ